MTYAVLANALVTFVEDHGRVVILRVVPSAAKHGSVSNSKNRPPPGKVAGLALTVHLDAQQ